MNQKKPAHKNRLSALAHPAKMRHSAAYSILVRKLRWLLPLMAMGIVLILLVWPQIQQEIKNIRFKVEPIDAKTLEQATTENRLLEANFSSTDEKGRPYTLKADEAIQQKDKPDFIALIKPKATLQNSDTDSLTLESQSGVMNQSAHILTLEDNVSLSRSDGTTLNTSRLNIDLNTQDAQTDQPISITGPTLNLEATAMHTENGGEFFVFQGPATLTLQSQPSINPKGGS